MNWIVSIGLKLGGFIIIILLYSGESEWINKKYLSVIVIDLNDRGCGEGRRIFFQIWDWKRTFWMVELDEFLLENRV